MVPSLRFLPRWWVLVAVLVAALLGALLGLGLVAWLALQAAAFLARSAPSETAGVQCPVAFPERGCPAVGQTLLALHCEAVNSTLFELYLSDLFATHMAQARNAREVEDDDGEEDEDSGDMLDGILERPDEGSAGPPVTDSSFVAQTQSAWRNQALRRERPRKSAGSPKGQQARGPRGQRQGRHNRRAPDTTTTMVCYLLVTLLVASAVLAVGEVLRDWWASVAGKAQAAALEEVGRPPAGIMPGMAAPPGSAAAAALAAAVEANRRGQFGQQLSRRCSLVDLTVSRHERRESMAAALAQAHGTHPNQASGQSHGQAGIGARPRPPPLSRRSSFSAAPAAAPLGRGPTACPSSGGGGGVGGRPPGGLGERGGSLGSDSASPRRRPSVSTPSLSLDLSDGDSSPDTGRKRVRIIRRH